MTSNQTPAPDGRNSARRVPAAFVCPSRVGGAIHLLGPCPLRREPVLFQMPTKAEPVSPTLGPTRAAELDRAVRRPTAKAKRSKKANFEELRNTIDDADEFNEEIGEQYEAGRATRSSIIACAGVAMVVVGALILGKLVTMTPRVDDHQALHAVDTRVHSVAAPRDTSKEAVLSRAKESAKPAPPRVE